MECGWKEREAVEQDASSESRERSGRAAGKPGVEGRLDAEGAFLDDAPSPLAEQWPYLKFLGLGAWWAWIWLCYFSTTLVGAFPDESRPVLVQLMYLISTLSIGITMVLAAGFRQRATQLVDSRGPIVFAGAVATLATAALASSGMFGGGIPFVVAAVLTGACTGALCLKVGRLYGTVNLSDSLTAGAVSLVAAALLFFVGLGIPTSWAVPYVAAMPLLAALLLCMPSHDPYGEGDATAGGRSVSRPIMVLYGRLVAAAAAVAMTAGIANGIASSLQTSAGYGYEGAVIVAAIGCIGVVLAWLVNRMAAQRKGARIAYTALMIAGVALMLGTGFGLPVSYLSIGKEALWLVLSCLMAFMAFRFGFSSVRAFALGQGVYFLSSTAGWWIGSLIAPSYGDATIRMAVGAIMAFAVVLIVMLLFTERDIKAILLAPVAPLPMVVGARPKFDETVSGAQGEGRPLAAQTVSDAASSAEETSDGARREEDLGFESANPRGTNPEGTNPEGAERSPRNRQLAERYGLSLREIEIMDLFAQGRSANWIADALFISKNTVRSHLRAIYTKLDVHTRQELIDRLSDLERDTDSFTILNRE